jgi:hypothetical protein
MSFKSKDLQYDDRQPAFLRRLRGEISGSVDDPDRQINPVARPKGSSRLKNDDEDDGPTYVMEDTNESLSKAEYEALVNGNKDDENAKTAENADSTTRDGTTKDEPSRAKQKVAAVGGVAKKRKVAKIMGDEDAAGVDEKIAEESKFAVKASDLEAKRPAKKKKAKAIKLSFGDDEDQ